MIDDNDRLLTTKQVAEMLATAPGTLKLARFYGTGAFSSLPYVRFGTAIRYRLSDVLATIDAATVRPRCTTRRDSSQSPS